MGKRKKSSYIIQSVTNALDLLEEFRGEETELGVTELEQKSGFKNAIVIFFAFIGGACFPVLPYLLMFRSSMDSINIFYIATFVTVAGLFMAGALKKFVTGVNWLKSGMEMLLVGLFAFFVSYLIGSFIPF